MTVATNRNTSFYLFLITDVPIFSLPVTHGMSIYPPQSLPSIILHETIMNEL